jgi:hypothetical protein
MRLCRQPASSGTKGDQRNIAERDRRTTGAHGVPRCGDGSDLCAICDVTETRHLRTGAMDGEGPESALPRLWMRLARKNERGGPPRNLDRPHARA